MLQRERARKRRREGGRRRKRGCARARVHRRCSHARTCVSYSRTRTIVCVHTQPDKRASTHARERDRARREQARCRLRKPACENRPIGSRGGSRWGSHVVSPEPMNGDAFANFESVSRLAAASFLVVGAGRIAEEGGKKKNKKVDTSTSERVIRLRGGRSRRGEERKEEKGGKRRLCNNTYASIYLSLMERR